MNAQIERPFQHQGDDYIPYYLEGIIRLAVDGLLCWMHHQPVVLETFAVVADVVVAVGSVYNQQTWHTAEDAFLLYYGFDIPLWS